MTYSLRYDEGSVAESNPPAHYASVEEVRAAVAATPVPMAAVLIMDYSIRDEVVASIVTMPAEVFVWDEKRSTLPRPCPTRAN